MQTLLVYSQSLRATALPSQAPIRSRISCLQQSIALWYLFATMPQQIQCAPATSVPVLSFDAGLNEAQSFRWGCKRARSARKRLGKVREYVLLLTVPCICSNGQSFGRDERCGVCMQLLFVCSAESGIQPVTVLGQSRVTGTSWEYGHPSPSRSALLPLAHVQLWLSRQLGCSAF